MNKQIKSQKGFTLIELLVVIGILAVLLAITLIAINPAKQFAQANQTKRRSDVNAILNAIDQYAADSHGALPGTLGTSCTSAACEVAGASNTTYGGGLTKIDLCPSLVTKYLAAFPVDPLVNNGTPVSTCDALYDSGYQVQVSSNDNRVTITAPHYELQDPISVTR